MEKFADKVETFLDHQLELYGALETVFEQEKRQIVDMDIDGLWKTVAAKKEIFRELNEMNRDMVSLMTTTGWHPPKDKKNLNLTDLIGKLPVSRKVKMHLKQIKMAVEQCREKVFAAALANKQYVQDSLVVINDIFTQARQVNNQRNYNYSGQFQENNATRLINTEV